MKSLKPVKIIGVGKYLPQPLPSVELEERHGLQLGWSERYSGVNSRHWVADFESNGYMGARALEYAMQNCGLSIRDLDMIISAAATHDYPIPNGASVIKQQLQDADQSFVPAIDIDTTCLSFITALQFSSSLIDGNLYKRVAIVSSEISSIGLNPDDKEILTLFGDGAAAVILEYDEDGNSGFLHGLHRTYSSGLHDSMMKGSGTMYWKHSYDPVLHSFSMNGINLLRLAKAHAPVFITEFFSTLPYSLSDIDIIIPHQASKAGLQMFRNQYTLPNTIIHETLYKYGNCIAASIPLTFIDALETGNLKRGDLCLLIGTSAGFSIGAALIKY